MKTRIIVGPQASEQILQIDTWWREYRPVARTLFTDELRVAFALLEEAPEVGRRYRSRRVPGVRRLLLRGSRYHIYYVFERDQIGVLAVWSAVRGRGPALNQPDRSG